MCVATTRPSRCPLSGETRTIVRPQVTKVYLKNGLSRETTSSRRTSHRFAASQQEANPARVGLDERAAKALSRVQRNADLTSRASSRMASRSAAWSARPAQFVSNCTPDSPMSRCRSFNFPTTVSGEPMNTEPRNVSSSVISVRRCEVFTPPKRLPCTRTESAGTVTR